MRARVCVRAGSTSRSSQLLFAGEDGAVKLLAELHVAPLAGLQEVQFVRQCLRVEALAAHLCFLELVRT